MARERGNHLVYFALPEVMILKNSNLTITYGAINALSDLFSSLSLYRDTDISLCIQYTTVLEPNFWVLYSSLRGKVKTCLIKLMHFPFLAKSLLFQLILSGYERN